MNGFHHGSQFDFYLKEPILGSKINDTGKIIMSTLTLRNAPRATRFARATLDAVRGLFTASSDVWALYRMNRGADSVSPAVLRHLAERASR